VLEALTEVAVATGLTVTSTLAELLGPKLLLPLYEAVIVCAPATSVLVRVAVAGLPEVVVHGAALRISQG
jgi:hypothetical protein